MKNKKTRKRGAAARPGLEPADCVCYGLRRAARLTAKAYDDALRPSGLRTTQFGLLASLNWFGESSIGDLADALAIDATTLTRNLAILIRRNLVESVYTDDARVRLVRLTEHGTATFVEALPLWRAAQQHLLATLKPKEWTRMKTLLNTIEGAYEGTS